MLASFVINNWLIEKKVNTITGFLTTPSLTMMKPLAEIMSSSRNSFFCTRGRIQKTRPGANGSYTIGLHSVCKKRIRADDEKGWVCDMCLCAADHRDTFFEFHVEISSLETQAWMRVSWKVGEELLGTSARDFTALSDRERQELIDKITGISIDLIASRSDQVLQLDALVLSAPIKMIQNA